MTLKGSAAAVVVAMVFTAGSSLAVPDAARTAWVLDVEQRAEANLARIRENE